MPQTLSDTDVKPGIQATAGTRFFLTPSIAFFTEYKFTHTADFNFSLISGPGTIAGNPAITVSKLKFDLNTDILAAGLSYHWQVADRARRAPFLDTRWLGHLEWIEVAIPRHWRT